MNRGQEQPVQPGAAAGAIPGLEFLAGRWGRAGFHTSGEQGIILSMENHQGCTRAQISPCCTQGTSVPAVSAQ